MKKNVQIIDLPITVKTVQVDSKKLTKATLTSLPVLPPTWHDLFQDKKLAVLGKIAKDVTKQLIVKRGYSELIDMYFDYGLIVYYDEQLFLTLMPNVAIDYEFSKSWSETKSQYKGISSELYGYRWPEDEPLSKDERDDMNAELEQLQKEKSIIEARVLDSINEIKSNVKYLFI